MKRKLIFTAALLCVTLALTVTVHAQNAGEGTHGLAFELIPNYIYYRVGRGETLYSIARANGISVQTLMEINRIAAPSFLRLGEVIKIPVQNTANIEYIDYTVVRGDTLHSIARANGISLQTLLEINGLQSAVIDSVIDYRAVRGDTLYSIARANGISLQTLLEINRFPSNHVMRVGDVIKIPAPYQLRVDDVIKIPAQNTAIEVNPTSAYRVSKGTVTSGAVIIPASFNGLPVIEIGSVFDTQQNGAFIDTRITSITIPTSIISIGTQAFDGCRSLTSITIPSSVTYIGFGAFAGCRSLTSIIIPSSVTYIGSAAFAFCISLTSVTVDTQNPAYSSLDGILFNKNRTVLVTYPDGKQGSYTIPSSITSIGDWAFSGCTSLTNIVIPSSVIYIGDRAFRGCTNLRTVTVSRRTTIGEDTFPATAQITYSD